MKEKALVRILQIVFVMAVVYMVFSQIIISSPMQYVDGFPFLNRIMLYETGQMSLGNYLFGTHGGSMHTIVYALGLLDSAFFSNIPVILSVAMGVALIAAALILCKILVNKENGMFLNLLFSIVVAFLVAGAYTEQLYLPFQIVLTVPRVLHILIFVGLIECFQKNKYGLRYILLICAASITSTMHGTSLMFAGALVFLHIIYYQKIKYVVVSFVPAIFTCIIHFIYNSSFGEVSQTGGIVVIFKYFKEFIKCFLAYYGQPIGAFWDWTVMPRIVLYFAGLIIGIYILVELVVRMGYGLHIFQKIKRLPKFMINKERTSGLAEGVMLALVGMSFLANLSQAFFTVARIELIPIFAVDPDYQTLYASRYLCYSVMPYIYLLWKFVNNRKVCSIIKYTAMIVLIVAQINLQREREIFLEDFSNQLDYSTVCLLSGMASAEGPANFIWQGHETDWYYKDQVPALFEYYENNNMYVWKNQPAIGSTIANDRECILLGNVQIQDETELYCKIEADTLNLSDKRYYPIVDINNTVVGYAFKQDEGGVFWGTDGLYYNRAYSVKGCILESAARSERFQVVLD